MGYRVWGLRLRGWAVGSFAGVLAVGKTTSKSERAEDEM